MTEPEPGPDRPAAGTGLRSPSWASLLAVVVLAGVIGFSVLLMRGSGGDSGARGLRTGTEIPPFAAPLVRSPLDGDVNLARKPDSGGAGEVAACSIQRPDVLTSCDLVEREPLIIGFATEDDRCLRGIDSLDSLRQEFGRDIAIVAVAVRGDRDSWRELARERWRIPVVHDRDGGLRSAFGVEVCPHATFVMQGGSVAGSIIGEASDAEMRRAARRLARGGSTIR